MNGELPAELAPPGVGPTGPAAPTRTGPLGLRTGLAGLLQGLLVGAAMLALLLPLVRTLQGSMPRAAAAAAPLQRQLDLGTVPASPDVRNLAQAIVHQGDNGTRPFVLIDKKDARLFVFEASGRLLGASPILLGYAAGDDSVSGIGQRPVAQVQPQERTTPAGRFVAQPGRNALQEQVVWVDYDNAVSMHRVRLTDPAERRLERLASPRAADRRISYGCINLPAAVFDGLVWPTLGARGGIVYVLPEFKRLEQVFPTLLPDAERANRLEPTA